MGFFDRFKTKQAPAAEPEETHAAAPKAQGILNLEKGGILNLTKDTQSTLTNLRAAAGWDVSAYGRDYDLDLCAFPLGENGKLVENVIYYGDKKGKGIELDHDNLTGEGEGDDENIFLNLEQVPGHVKEILLCVVIYQGKRRHQSFHYVRNAYVRLVDQAVSPEKELVRFSLSDDGGDNTAIRFARISRTPDGWEFQAIGEYGKASISDIQNEYL